LSKEELPAYRDAIKEVINFLLLRAGNLVVTIFFQIILTIKFLPTAIISFSSCQSHMHSFPKGRGDCLDPFQQYFAVISFNDFHLIGLVYNQKTYVALQMRIV